jgi:hypothetical protein
MKMSRLTEIDEFGNADIIGMEDETWQMGLSFNDMNKVTLALNRLHRLEKLYEQHKQPDPITGLVPCGCGGKVDVAFYPRWAGKPDLYRVDCFSCHVGTRPCQTAEQAKAAWNTAMGVLEEEG